MENIVTDIFQKGNKIKWCKEFKKIGKYWRKFDKLYNSEEDFSDLEINFFNEPLKQWIKNDFVLV